MSGTVRGLATFTAALRRLLADLMTILVDLSDVTYGPFPAFYARSFLAFYARSFLAFYARSFLAFYARTFLAFYVRTFPALLTELPGFTCGAP